MKTKQAVQLGNYLLSEERANRISEINKRNVTHADVENAKLFNKKL